ncbi:RNA polymerase sigma factor [Sphingobacterium griseoflavum]|uniref:DNA-directed RNA polymerase sigma-70 factor n=1 Tax=Sphingobacterium griseoflavum TaxID=1474952 RepID=A0ABQ3HXV9_9SPHI|nr:sigma-70 family RNA polymerase sigma factor [Sphingobacterium griseoflavum]GHE44555.1 DNA-directed RNA polymerase sigma-70 factor [Sphingobacterium griseoflavum]
MMYDSEKKLLEEFSDGRESAFQHIFHRYYARICYFATHFVSNSQDAEDIAEESFIKLWGGSRSFENLTHLKASLYQIARRVGINHQLAENRRAGRVNRYVAEQDEFQQGQDNTIIYSETMAQLQVALNLLPDKAQQIIRLTYLDGKTNQEVADEMGIALQTVKNQKLRALALLRKHLHKESFLLLLMGAFVLEKI